MSIVFFSLIIGAFAACYFYLTRNYNYWQNQGIPCIKDIFPGIGNMLPILLWRISFADYIQKIYKKYSSCSMIGFYNMTLPGLIIREPKLVKSVLKTNFHCFSDNLLKIDFHLNPLLSANPFFNSGEAWFNGRKRFVRIFSSSKLKILSISLDGICKKFDSFLNKELRKNNGEKECDLKYLFSRYTGEVAATMGFSIEGFCFEDEIRPTSYLTMAQKMFGPSLLSRFRENFAFFASEFNFIQLPYVPKKVDRIYRDIFRKILASRLQENVAKNDFLQLMMDMEKMEQNKRDIHEDFNVDSLAVQNFSFFTNIYDTSCGTISFTAYNLALYPNIQQKLRDEVKLTFAKYDGRLTYESLEEMEYLDQIISESNRLYSTIGIIAKLCTRECVLEGSDGLRSRVKPGTTIIVPVKGLQTDEKYWPDPDVFDPDRFAINRKKEIIKYTYLPFGKGRRSCPAMKLSLMMVKACLATLINKYVLELKSQEPLKLLPGRFLTEPVNGIWVNIKFL